MMTIVVKVIKMIIITKVIAVIIMQMRFFTLHQTIVIIIKNTMTGVMMIITTKMIKIIDCRPLWWKAI